MLCLCMMIEFANTSGVIAEGPWQQVVRRSTGDQEHDLIQELIRRQRFDEASSLCRLELKGEKPKSDRAAKWAIHLSRIATRKQCLTDSFDAAAVAEAQKPVTQLLSSYPGHSRALFLSGQLAWVEKEAARHDVLIASISPPSELRTEEVFRRLARVTRHVDDLAKEIAQARNELLNRNTTLVEKAIGRDLERLGHELLADIVSMSLMQTNLFPEKSRDLISAANKAEEDAEKALSVLPNNSGVRNEVDRMRVEAILRGGELERAEAELIGLVRQTNQPLPLKIQALIVHLDIRRDRLAQAEKRLQLFYGLSPDAAPRSIDMDLARLDYLISSKSRIVGSWLESIEKRNGAYARRRAEAISLSKLRHSGTNAIVDASIVAAQGKDWLRRNEPARAAKLLAAAALAERDPDLAIKRASEAAAAHIKANASSQAAEVLSAVALKNPNAKNASAANLQAAVVLSSSKASNAPSRIEQLLIQTVDRWPSTDAGQKAREWLILILTRQNRWADLAKTATQFLKHNPTQSEIDQAIEYWLQLPEKQPNEMESTIGQFQIAFAPLLGNVLIAKTYPFAACFLLESNDLHVLPVSVKPANPGQEFANAFLRFRRDQTEPELLKTVPPNRKPIAHWRLMRDAQSAANKRSSVANLLQQWGCDTPSDNATLLVWKGQTQKAIELITAEAKVSKQRSRLWKGLADTLVNSNQSDNINEAIKIWDRLSTGLPKATPEWHEAKINAIELMVRVGKVDDANRRAKYVLLTNPPQDSDLLRRYLAVSNR